MSREMSELLCTSGAQYGLKAGARGHVHLRRPAAHSLNPRITRGDAERAHTLSSVE